MRNSDTQRRRPLPLAFIFCDISSRSEGLESLLSTQLYTGREKSVGLRWWVTIGGILIVIGNSGNSKRHANALAALAATCEACK